MEKRTSPLRVCAFKGILADNMEDGKVSGSNTLQIKHSINDLPQTGELCTKQT